MRCSHVRDGTVHVIYGLVRMVVFVVTVFSLVFVVFNGTIYQLRCTAIINHLQQVSSSCKKLEEWDSLAFDTSFYQFAKRETWLVPTGFPFIC